MEFLGWCLAIIYILGTFKHIYKGIRDEHDFEETMSTICGILLRVLFISVFIYFMYN